MSAIANHRVLHTLTASFLAVGGWALVRGAALPDAVIAPAGLDSVAGSVVAEAPDAASAGVIVSANIFSDARRPPAVRYDPYAADPPATAAIEPPPETGVADDAGVPKLYGTVLGPDGPRALMRLDPALPVAQLYREGDRVGPYHVLRIQETSVILDTSDGRIVLRLESGGTIS